MCDSIPKAVLTCSPFNPVTQTHTQKHIFVLTHIPRLSPPKHLLTLIKSLTTGKSHPAIPPKPQRSGSRTGLIWFTAFCPTQKATFTARTSESNWVRGCKHCSTLADKSSSALQKVHYHPLGVNAYITTYDVQINDYSTFYYSVYTD